MKNLLGVLFMVLCVGSVEMQGQHTFFDRKFQQHLPGWMKESKVPAVGIALVENSELVFTKVYGFQRDSIPASDSSIFNVASLTKPIVTMLVLKMVSQHQWNLDEPLSRFWIDPDVASDKRHNFLTTRLVLSHTTGFPNWRWNQPGQKLAFEFDQGSKYQYSGEGLEYLRRTIEAKTGRSLEDLCKEYVFNACSMNDTRFRWTDEFAARFAEWHDREGHQYAGNESRITRVSAADDLMCTVGDYGKFAVSVLKKSGLSQQVYNEMISQQKMINNHVDQGLGWTIVHGLPSGEYALYHGGSDKGVRAIVLILPKSQRGIVVVTNGDGGMDVIKKIISETIEFGDQVINSLSAKP